MSREKNKIVKEKEVSKYLQKIEDKEKTIDDLRKQLDFTQKLLVAEKGEKQHGKSKTTRAVLCLFAVCRRFDDTLLCFAKRSVFLRRKTRAGKNAGILLVILDGWFSGQQH